MSLLSYRSHLVKSISQVLVLLPKPETRNTKRVDGKIWNWTYTRHLTEISVLFHRQIEEDNLTYACDGLEFYHFLSYFKACSLPNCDRSKSFLIRHSWVTSTRYGRAQSCSTRNSSWQVLGKQPDRERSVSCKPTESILSLITLLTNKSSSITLKILLDSFCLMTMPAHTKTEFADVKS